MHSLCQKIGIVFDFNVAVLESDLYEDYKIIYVGYSRSSCGVL